MKNALMILSLSLISLNAFAGDVKTFASNQDFDVQINVATCRDQVSLFYYNQDWSLYGSYKVTGTVAQGSTADQYQALFSNGATLEVTGATATYNQESFRLIGIATNSDCK